LEYLTTMKKHKPPLKDYTFDSRWTLFLDRDGVINVQLPGDYVREPVMFRFIEGVREAIAGLSDIFGRIVIVTNQQGIGKGLMTEADLGEVHRYMQAGITLSGGSISAVYHSPHLEGERNEFRKPGTGMAMLAKRDFPEIDFGFSVMVGDTPTDMEFGSRLGMLRVLISDDADRFLPESYDYHFVSLYAFYQALL
jgi:histidinol-phosphate phosphatase family protein